MHFTNEIIVFFSSIKKENRTKLKGNKKASRDEIKLKDYYNRLMEQAKKYINT